MRKSLDSDAGLKLGSYQQNPTSPPEFGHQRLTSYRGVWAWTIDLDMLSSTSPFVETTLSVDQNAVKSILFRIAAVLLQFAVLKSFSLWASWQKAFTAYLVFAEDYIQRALYIKSRRFTVNGLLVLAFTIFVAAAGLYDALLWGLDAPGYVAKTRRVRAGAIADRRSTNPDYVLLQSHTPDEISTLDRDLEDEIGADLFQPGINFTLTGEVDYGTQNIVAPTQKLTDAGPRIWLDQEGFSVSTDGWVNSAMLEGRSTYDTNATFYCPRNITIANGWLWNCEFPNIYSLPVLGTPLGRPEIHWDDASDLQLQSQYLSAHREDNPWATLGEGGSTVLMQQMFTVTKERQRHTFHESVLKITAVTDYDKPFTLDQVTDLVRRSWSSDPAQQEDPRIDTIARNMVQARARNASHMRGVAVGWKHWVAQSTHELLNVEPTQGNVTFTAMRITNVNISLVRSETLPEAVKPAGQCDRFYRNEASGGKVNGTSCVNSNSGNQTNHRFFGQVDTTAVVIFNYLLGNGKSNITSKALDQRGYDWYAKNEGRIIKLLLARGFIMGIDPNLVTVQISTVKAAISYLQILLILVAAVFALVSWGSAIVFASPHYSNSLLANLLATTTTINDSTEPDARAAKSPPIKPGYLHQLSEIQLGHEGTRTVLETATGVFRLVNKDGTARPAVAAAGDTDSSNQHSFDQQLMLKSEMQTTTTADVVPTPPPVSIEQDPLLLATANARSNMMT